MTRTRLLLPLSLAATLLAAAALTAADLPASDPGVGQSVAVSKDNNRDKQKNPCKYPANTRPTITEAATPRQQSKPGDVKFSGKAKANCGLHKGQVGLYGKDGPSGSSGAWTLRGTTTTTNDGDYTITYRVPTTGDFKLVWPGDETFPAAQSDAVTVKIGK